MAYKYGIIGEIKKQTKKPSKTALLPARIATRRWSQIVTSKLPGESCRFADCLSCLTAILLNCMGLT